MNRSLYFHVATIGNYQQVFDEIYSKVLKSGLYYFLDNVNICIVGGGNLKVPQDVNVFRDSDISKGEFFTLEKIENISKSSDENLKILYLHTKGVTNPNNQCIIDWRKYMTYHNVIKYDKCIKALDCYDACGVDFVEEPAKHFSGNFWWANSFYIKTLPNISDISKKNYPSVLTTRHNAEFWLGMGNGKFASFWNSNIPVFERHLHEYPEHNYK